MAGHGCALWPRAPRGVLLAQALEQGSGFNAFLRDSRLGLELVRAHPRQRAWAQWKLPAGTQPANESQVEVVTLKFGRSPRLADWRLFDARHRVEVRPPAQWRHVLRETLRGLVPSTPHEGLLVDLAYSELVLYRDATGRMRSSRLETKPAEVRIVRTADSSALAQQTLQRLPRLLGTGQPRVLFATGQDPALVLVDLDRNQTVFFCYPANLHPAISPVSPPFAFKAVQSLIWRSFILTALKNPCTLLQRGAWHMGQCGMTLVSSGLPPPTYPAVPLHEGTPMDVEQFEQDLDRLVSSRRYPGHLELLIDGREFFPALIHSIQNARKRIDLRVYIFDNDDYAVGIANLLKKRSQEVQVRVLYDELGSLFSARSPPASAMPPEFQPPLDIGAYLKRGSRVHVRKTTNPWLTADHTKLILIDDQEAFLGGMNIGREYRYDWHDLMVRLTGPVVGPLRKEFLKAWAHAGPLGDLGYAWESLFRTEKTRQSTPAGRTILIRPLYTKTGRTEIYKAQMLAIERARHHIYIENPYLTDDTVLRALIAARRRGVDVRVIFPTENDSGLMKASNLVTANRLIQHHIRVFLYPGMTHVKAGLFDGWACLGSANFDKLSLRVNQELNIAFSDPETVSELKQRLFEADCAKSREIKSPLPADWFDSLVATLADQF